MAAKAVIDLPEPDSPTTPRISPWAMEKEISSTTLCISPLSSKPIVRWLTSNNVSMTALLTLPGSKAFADHAKSQNDQNNSHARRQCVPGRIQQIGLGL